MKEFEDLAPFECYNTVCSQNKNYRCRVDAFSKKNNYHYEDCAYRMNENYVTHGSLYGLRNTLRRFSDQSGTKEPHA